MRLRLLPYTTQGLRPAAVVINRTAWTAGDALLGYIEAQFCCTQAADGPFAWAFYPADDGEVVTFEGGRDVPATATALVGLLDNRPAIR